MKKNFLYAGLFLLFTVTACQDKNKNTQGDNDNGQEVDVVEEDEIDELPNTSDIDFEEALAAFEEGKNEIAAQYIEAAIEDLEEEGEDMTDDAEDRLEKSIESLEDLVEKVRNGSIKDIETLEEAFANAEMTVAHNYFMFSNTYMREDQQEEAKTALQTAVEKMKNASKKLKGTAKSEVDNLLAESEALLEKGDDKANKMGNAIGKQMQKIGQWMDKHTEKIQPAESDEE